MADTWTIQLRSPLAGDLVGQQLVVAAIGTAFEASYGWRLLTDTGDVVQDGFFQAGSMGTLEAFAQSVPMTHTHVGPATFELFGDDPSGEHAPGVDLVSARVVLVPGARGYRPHQVVRGDTLSALAREHGSQVAWIVAANGIPDPDLIRVGQVLRIPV
ncbi:LysM peptidoglycan-binding domain-containing protein [Cellulomonas sp. 179-A 9B4 NHS]|uniref:LysM peptidoglycan-binding domain-containing protein n=1 Tax=Cellulomonas sp. 179-A 9B4 NHS TaxID=3142379 RepID=UPI0039A10D7F